MVGCAFPLRDLKGYMAWLEKGEELTNDEEAELEEDEGDEEDEGIVIDSFNINEGYLYDIQEECGIQEEGDMDTST